MCRSERRLSVFGIVAIVAMLAVVSAGVFAVGCTSATATTSVAAAPALPAAQPADFGFVASYGAYGKNRLDTFAGTFTKDIINPAKPNPTATLRLTADQMATLYQDLRVMEFQDFPESLDPGNTDMTASTPTSYRLDILAGGVSKTVSFAHGDLPKTKQAKDLVAWFEKLRGMIEATPEYKQMPPLEGGYA
jgi:hypothetical protein